MASPTVRDLIELVVTEVPDPEARLESVFEWQHRRDSMISKAAGGFAGSLTVGLFIAFLAESLDLSDWQIAGVAVGIVGPAVFGFYRWWTMRRIPAAYLTGLATIARLRGIKPFLLLITRRDSD